MSLSMSAALLSSKISPLDIGGLFYTLSCFPKLAVDFCLSGLPSKRRQRADQLIVSLLLPFGCEVTFSQLLNDLVKYGKTCGIVVRGSFIPSRDGLLCKFVFEI